MWNAAKVARDEELGDRHVARIHETASPNRIGKHIALTTTRESGQQTPGIVVPESRCVTVAVTELARQRLFV
jgi:hypothetical protein